jgi:DNA transposition AAA+ family ATPase
MRSTSRLSRLWTWLLLCGAAFVCPADGAAGGFMGRCAGRDARGALERPNMTTTFATAWDAVDQDKQVREVVRSLTVAVPISEPVGDQEGVLARIREHLERYGIAPATLAKELDVKVGVVTLLLNDPERIPAGPRATLLRDAEAWCGADAHERELRAARIIPTAVTRLVGGIARAVRETKTVGLVFGGCGLGKSHALDAVRAGLPGQTIIARADPAGRGVKGLLRAIGAATKAGPAATMMPSVKAAIEAVRGSGGLLIIDEAQLLPAMSAAAAQAIFDGGDVGLLLVGTTALRRTLNPAADPLVGPLCSRVALRVDLDAELLGPGRNGQGRQWIDGPTVAAIVGRHMPQPIDAGGMNRLVEAANFRAGHLRTAVNAARVAAFLARRRDKSAEAAVTDDDVALALRMGWGEGS